MALKGMLGYCLKNACSETYFRTCKIKKLVPVNNIAVRCSFPAQTDKDNKHLL